MTHTAIDIAALKALARNGKRLPILSVLALIAAAKERDALVQGLNSIINMKSHVGRSAVREYAAAILEEKAYSTADQSPIANTLASLRALLAGAGRALKPLADVAETCGGPIDGAIFRDFQLEEGEIRRAAAIHASIQSALRDAPPTTGKPK